MNAPARPSNSAQNMAQELAAALEWWREAGVDSDMGDEPKDWLVDAHPSDDEPPVAQTQAASTKKPGNTRTGPPFTPSATPQKHYGGDKADWPSDLAMFQLWWLEDASLDDDGSAPALAPRIPPRGKVGAELMIIVPHPEQSDSDTLLSGSHGALLRAMLRAMQIAPEDIYLAAALTRYTPLPDWEGLQSSGLGDILAHHITLAAPKRLLLLGRRILPLLPHNTAQGSVALREINHDGANVPSAAGAGLDTMLAQPGEKARFWRRWLEWTA